MYILKFYCSYASGDIFKEIYERLCETVNLDYYEEDKRYILPMETIIHI